MITNRKDKKGEQGENLPAPNPKITFEVIDGNQLKVQTEWPPGADLNMFGHLLLYLCQGKLVGAIVASISLYATRINEVDKGAQIYMILQQGLTNPEEDGPDGDDPVVCPTNAMRLNMKPFQG